MEKTNYSAPLTEVLDFRIEGALLIGSVEAMNEVAGSWEEDS